MRQAAALLARAGFDVAVPTIPGLTRGRLRPDDVEPVVATLDRARGADRDDRRRAWGPGRRCWRPPTRAVRERVRVVLSLGGYASAIELLRFFLTGDFRWGTIHGHVAHDPAIVAQFVEANADLLDLPARDLLTDPRGAVALLEAPPPRMARVLNQLSPERVARGIGPGWCSSTAHAIVPCPTPRACAWRRPVRSGLASSWWASWTTWRRPGARRGCRGCGSWEGCSSRCTASPGRPDRGFCAGDSRPRSPRTADVSSPGSSQARLVSS